MTVRSAALDVIRPGDPRYDSVRHVYTAQGSPAAVVRVRRAAEVPAALALARQEPGPVAVRSGGHGIGSIATNDGGTVIDLSALDHVQVGDAGRVRIEAGARWGRVAEVLGHYGLAISSGDSGDVGVGGLATGGGIGLLGRAHGLTIDSMTAADIVTADGASHRATASDHPELFWAVRGAGGAIGIVTAFEFDAARIAQVGVVRLVYADRDRAGLLQRWGAAIEVAPRAVTGFLYLSGPVAHGLLVIADDDPIRVGAMAEPFTSLPGIADAAGAIAPYARALLTTGASHRGQQTATVRTGLATHVDREIAGRIADLTDAAPAMVQIRSVGGAINDVGADATSYAHRHQNFCISAMSAIGSVDLDRAWQPVRERTDGSYGNLQSRWRPQDLTSVYPLPTLARLRTIKDRVDPDRVFGDAFDVSDDGGC